MARAEHTPTLERPGPRLFAGAVGGFLAGVAFIALTCWYSATLGNDPLAPFRVIASMAPAPDVIPTLWLGMALHSALSVFFGMVFAAFTALTRGNGTLMPAGFLFGGLIYVINFQILARFVGQFAAFRGVNQPFEVAIHLMFGGLVAMFLLRRTRRVGPSQPVATEEVPRVPSGT